MMTEYIIKRLREGRIDAGLLVTPLQENGIKEEVLFYEELLVYVSPKNAAFKKQYVLAKDIDPEKLWLLEEGHCFRSQIVNLCELKKASEMNAQFEYEAGSIETLRRMVELNDGITILPELSTLEMTPDQQKRIRRFQNPAPVREVSMVVHRDFMKKRLKQALKEEIIAAVPEQIKKKRPQFILPV